jgi:hypothetical protein
MTNQVTQRGLQHILTVMDRRPEPWHCAWIEARDSIQALANQTGLLSVPGADLAAIIDTAYQEHREDYSLLQIVGAKRGVGALAEDREGELVGGLVQAVCRLLGVRDGRDGPDFWAWDTGLRERMEARVPQHVPGLQALHDACLGLWRAWMTRNGLDQRPWASIIYRFVVDGWYPLAQTGGTPGQLTGPIYWKLKNSKEFKYDDDTDSASSDHD